MESKKFEQLWLEHEIMKGMLKRLYIEHWPLRYSTDRAAEAEVCKDVAGHVRDEINRRKAAQGKSGPRQTRVA